MKSTVIRSADVVLLGPPGAGKGTQAARLRDESGFTHVSTGDLLRRRRAARTDLGLEAAEFMTSGRLVPSSLVIAMLVRELQGADGVLLDGFPRTRSRRRRRWRKCSRAPGGR